MDKLNGVISLIVVVGTLGSMLAFFLILHLNRTIGKEGQTTGHNYDGIEELDNPLPSWWYWMFVLTIVFGLGYLIVFPGLGNFKGVLGWSSLGELEKAEQRAEEQYGPIFAAYSDVPLEELANNEEAMNIGRRLFSNHCAVCHGATAQGSVDFPNLTDEEWIWGGEPAMIETTILNGRSAAMPPWAPALGELGVTEVTEYVQLISGQQADPSLAERGRSRFSMICASCHGADGTGNPTLGAPNLTNDIWLYGGSRAVITEGLVEGRYGEMPAFAERIGEDKVHILAAYILSLQQDR